jgi:hypothetical protein
VSRFIRFVRALIVSGYGFAFHQFSAFGQDSDSLPLLKSPDERGVLVHGSAVIPLRGKMPREVGSFIERGLLTIEAARLSGFESSSQVQAPTVGDLMGWLDAAPMISSPSRKLWDAALVNAQGLTRRLRLEQKVLPVTAGTLAEKQSFREFLTLKMPQPLAGYSWLTFRMKGEEEDAVWVGAPSFTRQVRQVSGTNRGDPIIPGGVAPDEFGVFAGKSAWIGEPELKGTSQLVAINRRRIQLRPTEGSACEASVGEPFGRWNFDGQRMKNAKPWSPTDAVFTERRVVRVQFYQGDPQSDRVVEEVVIDLDTKLPVYRASYGAGSTPLRVVIGTLGFLESLDRTPIIVSQIVFAPVTSEVALLGLRQLEVCKAGSDGFTLDAFDPSVMEGAVATTPVAQEIRAVRPTSPPSPKERVIGSGRSHVVAIPGVGGEVPTDEGL